MWRENKKTGRTIICHHLEWHSSESFDYYITVQRSTSKQAITKKCGGMFAYRESYQANLHPEYIYIFFGTGKSGSNAMLIVILATKQIDTR